MEEYDTLDKKVKSRHIWGNLTSQTPPTELLAWCLFALLDRWVERWNSLSNYSKPFGILIYLALCHNLWVGIGIFDYM